MLVEKEVFNKYIKLISAGIIQTSAKNIHGLTLNEIINLPLNGNQILNLKLDGTNTLEFIDSGVIEDIETNNGVFDTSGYEFSKDKIQNWTIENKLKSFIDIITIILNHNKDVISKDKITFSFYLTLKNCYIVKNNCIIDINNENYNYLINFGESVTDSLLNIENLNNEQNLELFLDYIYNLIKINYVDDIINTSYSKYKVLKSIKDENKLLLDTLNLDSSVEVSNLNTINSNEWFNDLLNDVLMYVDFEFGVIDITDDKNRNDFDKQLTSITDTNEILIEEVIESDNSQPNILT